jgi:hypothetical protein
MQEPMEAQREREERLERLRGDLDAQQREERMRAREEGRPERKLKGLRQRPVTKQSADEKTGAAAARGNWTLRAPASINALATNVHVSDPNLDDPNEGDAQSEASMAAWKSYVVCAWNDGQGQSTAPSSIGFGYSTNNGQTFVDGGSPPEAPNNGTWSSDPVVVVNEATGEFYFCALLDLGDTGDEHGVGVVRGTFSGETFTWDSPVIVNSIPEVVGFIDKCWVAVDPGTGNLYVTYTHYYADKDEIILMRSTNKGLSWGTPLTMSSIGAAVQGSRPCVGPDGEVYVTWKEIGPVNGDGSDFFRIRKSTDGGVSFGPERQVARFYDDWGTGAPGFNREQSVALPSIAIDRSNGPHRGRVYVTWNESLNWYDSPPDLTPLKSETEPNDDPSTANSFVPGDVLVGNYKASEEFDYYKFNAVQNVTYIFFCDTSTYNYTMRIMCTDGQTRLAFSGDRFTPSGFAPAPGLIVWTCPQTGTYYLRMAEAGQVAGGVYRVLTGVDIPGGVNQRALDHRDIFLATSDDGGTTWTNPVQINAGQVEHFDDWLPEVAVDGAGTAYLSWYDWSDSPAATCGALSHVYLSKSVDGGVTWQSQPTVTEVQTNWTVTNSNIIPNQGDYICLFANGVGLYPVWADGRVGTPDVWTAPMLINGLKVTLESSSVDTVHVVMGWLAQGPYPPTANVYRAAGSGNFQLVSADVAFDGTGRITYDDASVNRGTRYRYRLGVDVNGTEMFLGEGAVTVPTVPVPALALEGVIPNPSPGTLMVSFTLPDAAIGRLSLFDASGRWLRSMEVQGPGQHLIDFGSGFEVKPGLYFMRLEHGGKKIVRRLSIVP